MKDSNLSFGKWRISVAFDSVGHRKTWIRVYLLQSLRMEDVSLLSFDFQVSRIENESRIIFINH